MNLSFKDIQFIIEALEYQIKAYHERINLDELDEDEVSDIGNDCAFLEALCQDFKNAVKEKTMPHVLKVSARV